jgi:hypothetical protein
MFAPRLLTLTASLLLLAGCFGPTDPVAPLEPIVLEEWPFDEFPVELDHEHGDADAHALAHNIEFVAYTSCTSQGTVASAVGGFTDMAFRPPYAFVGNSRGFCILDISDPTAPRFVSQYVGEHSSDLEVSSDGNVAFLLTQRNPVTSAADPVTEPTANLPRGVHIVDVRDKERPVFESYYPVPTNGVHTATAYQHGDRQLVFIQTYDWAPPAELLPPGVQPPTPSQNTPGTQRVEITELKRVQGKLVLERLSLWSLSRPATEPFAQWFPHDAYPQVHPVTGRTYLYIAYWDAGLVLLDVTDPANPTFVSRIRPTGSDADLPGVYGQFHDVKPFPTLINERHITVTGPEISSSPVAGRVWFFDTTNPEQPRPIAYWRLPGDPGTPGGFQYSPHVFTLHEDRVYIGHNHGGVWVIQLVPPAIADGAWSTVSAGFHFPRGNELTEEWSATANVWGAYWHDGFVYATEGRSGVHVLRYLGDLPAHVLAA